jgi:mRNA-degrading endonuclease RelE of RelBE toxin-antitoxin system
VSPIGIEWDDTAERDLRRLESRQQKQVATAVERLAALSSLDEVFRNKNVRRLTNVAPPGYRLRVGDLRVIFVRTPTGIRIRRVALRPDAYR